MPVMAATHSSESSFTPAPIQSRRTSLDEIAGLARRRAVKLHTSVPVDVLVQQTLSRFDDIFGDTASPLDLDGWLRRAMREIIRVEERARRDAPAEIRSQAELEMILAKLATPVRAPALAKQRKLMLRRIGELISGPERRVVLAMITESSLDRVADQLRISPIDVARLQRRGLTQLQLRLDHDPELARQLSEASRQPRRARTSK